MNPGNYGSTTPPEYRTEEWALRAQQVKLSSAQRRAIEGSSPGIGGIRVAPSTMSSVVAALVSRQLVHSVEDYRLTALGLAVRAQCRTEPLVDNRYDPGNR